MTKSEIRKDVLTKRTLLTCDFVKDNSKYICNEFIKKYPDENLIVFAYFGVKNEVETTELFKYYKNVFLPKTVDDHLEFFKYDGKVTSGKFNIPEPCGIKAEKDIVPDVIVVPGVGFDFNKNRTGYGKGFYDKFLIDYIDVKKIAFAFSFQMYDEISDADFFDIKVDEIITEKKYYE